MTNLAVNSLLNWHGTAGNTQTARHQLIFPKYIAKKRDSFHDVRASYTETATSRTLFVESTN